ncbi:unnamed protein product, partial [Prorocentrum cordatum]
MFSRSALTQCSPRAARDGLLSTPTVFAGSVTGPILSTALSSAFHCRLASPSAPRPHLPFLPSSLLPSPLSPPSPSPASLSMSTAILAQDNRAAPSRAILPPAPPLRPHRSSLDCAATMARRGSAAIAFSGCLLLASLWHLRGMTGFVGSTAAQAGRRPIVQANAVDKAMKERIASVAKTGKLTEAMRLVAAAKVRRAQAGVEKARPFSDELSSMIKGLVKKLKGSGLESELPMLRVPEKVSNVGIVLITSDRGLCGGYNARIMKKAAARIEDLNKEGIVPKMIIVGKKALSGLNTKLKEVKLNYTGTFIRMPDSITSSAIAEIGDELRNLFLSGEVDKVEVIYAKFINLLLNEPQVRT